MGETYFSFAGFEDTLNGGIKLLATFLKLNINIWDEQMCSIINNRFDGNPNILNVIVLKAKYYSEVNVH